MDACIKKQFDERKQDWLVQKSRLLWLQRLGAIQAESPFLLLVKSPEVIIARNQSDVARNAELGGSKFYHAQQYPSIPITHLSPLFRLIED